MTSGKRVAIYARVSTTDQTAENQLLDLRSHCARLGWIVVKEFTDTGWSGSKKDRPALDQLMAFVHKRLCDCVLVWRYDRFARSVSHLVTALEIFRERGVDFASYHEGIDTGTAQGKFFFTVVAGFAEFERDLIRERIHAGLRRARVCKNCGHARHPIGSRTKCESCDCRRYESTKQLGRPGLPKETIEEILAMRGTPHRTIAARVGLSKSAVTKVLAAHEQVAA